jgi:hypothetical protein
MAITSMPWDGVQYPSSTWDNLYESMGSPGRAAAACVVKGAEGIAAGNLKVTGATSPVSVEPGQCWVKGKLVRSSSTTTINITTPASNPRIDRIIVKIVYATGVATIERLAGAEAVAPVAPTLTQIDGTQWEVSLAQVNITTGGAITVTNERCWAVPLGVFMTGQVIAIKATLGGTGSKHPIDVDLGRADEDWSLCDGSTYNGFVSPDLRDRMIIGAGTTYAAGTAYGAATYNVAHTHTQGNTGNESTHTHAQGNTGAEAAHTHYWGAGASAASGSDFSAWYNNISGAGSSHVHTNPTTAAGSAHAHTNPTTASGGSATQSVLNPCLALAYFCYTPLL